MLDTILTPHYQATTISYFIYILAINCFDSSITCFEYGLCNTCCPRELTSLEQHQHKG